jgi:hypothetical protein
VANTKAQTPAKASKQQQDTTVTAPAPKEAEAWPPPQLRERMTALIGRAQEGDAKAMAELRPILAKLPDWETLYENPAAIARSTLLEAVAGKNLFVREAWQRRTQRLQTELEGPTPTPLEHILCGRIASCWLDAHLADLTFAGKLKVGMTFGAGEYYQKRQDSAHKRYLSAVLTLAKVRRLLAPVVAQVNIAAPGAQQLNVAAPATPVTPAKSAAPKERDPLALAENQDG